MKVSLKWLGDHVDFTDYPTEKLETLLTFAGIEVEGTQTLPDKLVAAKIISSEKHPDADKLSVCQVDDGSGQPRQIVCGASNYQNGDHVALALPGCVLRSEKGEPFEIREGKLRGIDSLGMMCSSAELGLTEDAEGLLILSSDLQPGTALNEVFPTIFDLEITPNRPDCLSHLGIARELAALVGKPLNGPPDHSDSPTPTRSAGKDEIQIHSDACPYYTARWIRGVKVGESPQWLKEKLESIGLRPLNNIVDVTNYVLMEMGQPLHAFDLARLQGGIQIRQAEDQEEFLALDGKQYQLRGDDLVIADSCNAVAIGGVMGGENSCVTEATTDILLESAYFIPSSVRRTARTLGLSSDSSYRFERGVDPHQINGASDLATQLILDLAGGQADSELVVCGSIPSATIPVALDNEYCRKIIGTPIPDGKIDEILETLGLKKGRDGWKIPTYRLDLERPIDLVEEIARVYGIENVPATTSAWFAPSSKADASYDFTRKIQQSLSEIGFFETRNLKLVSSEQLEDDRATSHRGRSPVRLKNPLNDEQDYLRPALIPGLLSSAARNGRYGNTNLRLFETGRVFTANPKEQIIEQEHLALLMTGAREVPNWSQPKPNPLDLPDLKAVLDHLCAGKNVILKPLEKGDRLLCPVSIEIGRGKGAGGIGQAGIIPPARAREMDFDAPILVAEINLKKLAGLIHHDVTYIELPKFPGSSRDIAMVVPADMPTGAIADFFASVDEPLLVDVELFDVFTDPTGQKLDTDKKSLAWSLQYRAPDRTLEAAEIESAHSQLLDSLQSNLQVEFR